MTVPLCPRGHEKTVTRYGTYERWRCLICAKASNARRNQHHLQVRQVLRQIADEQAEVIDAGGAPA